MKDEIDEDMNLFVNVVMAVRRSAVTETKHDEAMAMGEASI